jgi:hypothetical protein
MGDTVQTGRDTRCLTEFRQLPLKFHIRIWHEMRVHEHLQLSRLPIRWWNSGRQYARQAAGRDSRSLHEFPPAGRRV